MVYERLKRARHLFWTKTDDEIGGGAHADHEYLVIDAMAERTSLVAGLLNAIQNS